MEPHKKLVIYTAGPFRPVKDKNNMHETHLFIERAKAFALMIWQTGHVALCPHANTGLDFQGAAPDDVWLAGDLELLKRCDAVLMLPDWKQSCGANLEKRHAEEQGIPVFFYDDLPALFAWAAAQ